jgi:hypothetical protein
LAVPLWQDGHASGLVAKNGEPCNGFGSPSKAAPKVQRNPTLPGEKMAGEVCGISVRVTHLTASGTSSMAPCPTASLPLLERAVEACAFSGKALMSLLISRRFARNPLQHRLHMGLDGQLVGFRSALRRLGHRTLLHAAVCARAGQDDSRIFERCLL